MPIYVPHISSLLHDFPFFSYLCILFSKDSTYFIRYSSPPLPLVLIIAADVIGGGGGVIKNRKQEVNKGENAKDKESKCKRKIKFKLSSLKQNGENFCNRVSVKVC